MTIRLPTKFVNRGINLAGVDLSRMIQQLSVYETVQKPYLTAKAIIIDNNNVIDNMQLSGGEDFYFAFDGAGGKVYEQQMHLINVKGEKSSHSLRSMIYTMEFIGPEFFVDQKNIVQQAFKGMPGTQAIQKLHGQFFGTGLSILQQSLGPISLQSYIVNSKKPFTAINDIKKRLTYGNGSGLTMYFRDAEKHVLAPLEALFASMGQQGYFIQKATWGENWFDIIRTQNAIIVAVAEVEFNDGSGRGSAKDVASAAKQGKTTFDVKTKKMVKKLASQIDPGNVVGSVANLGKQVLSGSRLGGKANFHIFDSAHTSAINDQSAKSEKEQLYNAVIKNGPVITVKVPIQSGINCTVGKGVYLDLLPPTGDINVGTHSAKGQYLVMNLMHELFYDDRLVNATTTMACARGGQG